MTIKKGIVVLSGSTETHKFLDDGSGRIGRTDVVDGNGYANSRIEFSGSVFVEGVALDVVEEVHALKSSQESLTLSINTRIPVEEAARVAKHDAMTKEQSEDVASLQAVLDAETKQAGEEQASVSTALESHNNSLTTRMTDLSSSIDDQISARIAEHSAAQSTLDGVDQEITDMKGSSNLFGPSASYTKSISGMVAYALSVDGTSDAAALAAVNAKQQEVDDEVKTRGENDAALAADLAAEAVARASAASSLSTRMSDLRADATSKAGDRESELDKAKSSTEGEIATADASLVTLLSSSVDGSGELSARASADASLQAEIDAANKQQTEDYASLTTRLSAQISKRTADVASLAQKVVDDTATNSALQSTAESLIIDEENAQAAADSAFSTSLGQTLIDEKADHDAEDATLSAAISTENSQRVSRDVSLTSQLSTQVSLFDSSMSSLSTRLDDQESNRGAMELSISSRISTDVSLLSEAVGGTALNGDLSTMISFIDGVDDATDAALLAAFNSLSTEISDEASDRAAGDSSVQALIDAEVKARGSAVGGKDYAFSVMAATTHPGRVADLLADTDTMFSEVDSTYVADMEFTASETVTAEETARESADDTISGSIHAEAVARIAAVSTQAAARVAGDAAISTRIANLETTLSTGQLTLSGTLDGAGNVTVDGTMQVGRLTVAEATSAGYLTASADLKGKMFYLDAPVPTSGPAGEYAASADFRAVFAEPQKWYFYEDGVWHPMPFYYDYDGDGVGDNLDHFPTNASESVDEDGDGVGNNADAFPNDPTETVDADGDGVGANSDPDDNNPMDPNAQLLVTMDVDLDSYPGEHIYIKDGYMVHGYTVASGFPHANFGYTADGSTNQATEDYSVVQTLVPDTPVTLKFGDTYGDGGAVIEFSNPAGGSAGAISTVGVAAFGADPVNNVKTVVLELKTQGSGFTFEITADGNTTVVATFSNGSGQWS